MCWSAQTYQLSRWHTVGPLLSKQRLAHWFLEVITIAYRQAGFLAAIMKGYSLRSSWHCLVVCCSRRAHCCYLDITIYFFQHPQVNIAPASGLNVVYAIVALWILTNCQSLSFRISTRSHITYHSSIYCKFYIICHFVGRSYHEFVLSWILCIKGILHPCCYI